MVVCFQCNTLTSFSSLPRAFGFYVTDKNAVTEHLNILVIGCIRNISVNGKKRRKAS